MSTTTLPSLPETPAGASDGRAPELGVASGSLLSWENRDVESLRGFLTNHPETTLFIIEAAPFEEMVTLSGALIPDDEEPEKWLLSNAKAAAEQYLRDWLLNVAVPLLANGADEPRRT